MIQRKQKNKILTYKVTHVILSMLRHKTTSKEKEHLNIKVKLSSQS